jgi:SecD/SecF fusion protein
VLALASFGVIAYGSVVAIGATLTLPGLAGLLLSAGLAIDANVLVFERAREEFHAQRQPRLISALDRGFSKALSAITDSNTTTVLAAALLFLLASGPVRGFGVTLTIGVIASIVSALLVTRVLTDFAVQRKAFAKRPRLTGIGFVGRVRTWLESSGLDLMKRAGLWLGLSAAVLAIAFGGMLLRGFNFGVEFTGGRVVEYSTSERISVEQARAAVSDAGFPTAVVPGERHRHRRPEHLGAHGHPRRRRRAHHPRGARRGRRHGLARERPDHRPDARQRAAQPRGHRAVHRAGGPS